MLSLDECRRILNRPDLSDAEVERIRDSLYVVAHALIDEVIARKRKRRGSTPTGHEPENSA